VTPTAVPSTQAAVMSTPPPSPHMSKKLRVAGAGVRQAERKPKRAQRKAKKAVAKAEQAQREKEQREKEQQQFLQEVGKGTSFSGEPGDELGGGRCQRRQCG
jgi:hypothetical protein